MLGSGTAPRKVSVHARAKDSQTSGFLSPQLVLDKFEMFQLIISFINLIPPVFKLAYVPYVSCLKGCFKTYSYICHICLTSEVKVVKKENDDIPYNNICICKV